MHRLLLAALAVALATSAAEPPGQAPGTAGTVTGTVTDPTGGVIAGATVEISNARTGYRHTTTTDAAGAFRFVNVPANNYHLEVNAPGFQPNKQDLSVRSTVPLSFDIGLKLAGETTSVEVHSEVEDVAENVPTAHVDLDTEVMSKLPRQSPGSGLSDVLTLTTPGVVADSNGFFHPLGDHAQTGFSIDNQPVTDQQSKQFSTQLPVNAVQSVEAIFGAPPAEYGDKTALVVNVTTKSGLGAARPFGSVNLDYGSFGTYGEAVTLGFGGQHFGNFLVANANRSGRFLDTPEFTPLHAIGNNQQFFDRVDFQPDQDNTIHLNLSAARSWFQIPNTWDQQFTAQDQRQQVRSFNLAAGWTRILNPSSVFTFTPYLRRDEVQYFPSNDVFSDLPATLAQIRQLTNAGARADVSFARGIHNAKIGVQYSQTILRERFSLGLTDPSFNPVCETAAAPVPGPRFTDPAQCPPAGLNANPGFQPGLLPFDLSRGGTPFRFTGGTAIKQLAAFVQDTLTLGRFSVNLGLRGESYNGLSGATALEPRLGLSYLYKPTGTVLRASYSRFFETPYNENLVLSSATGAGGLAANVFGAFAVTPLQPGRRNQFGTGFQQVIGRHLLLDADYFWKNTANAYDFDTLLNTPIQFPISWRLSKIDGLAARLSLVHVKGISAYTALGHTRARFFGPENGGLVFNAPVDAAVFRIDHDQALEQTTNVRFQPVKEQWWLGLTWRFDSGMASGSVESFDQALTDLTGAEQAAIGLHCAGSYATPFQPIRACPAAQVEATRLRIPSGDTYNPDTNPTRVAPRNLFDLAIGNDNLLKGDRYKVTLLLSANNVTNNEALYNFLSTFSGTHFVTPRALRVEIGFVF
jgi:hypothetical protein